MSKIKVSQQQILIPRLSSPPSTKSKTKATSHSSTQPVIQRISFSKHSAVLGDDSLSFQMQPPHEASRPPKSCKNEVQVEIEPPRMKPFPPVSQAPACPCPDELNLNFILNTDPHEPQQTGNTFDQPINFTDDFIDAISEQGGLPYTSTTTLLSSLLMSTEVIASSSTVSSSSSSSITTTQFLKPIPPSPSKPIRPNSNQPRFNNPSSNPRLLCLCPHNNHNHSLTCLFLVTTSDHLLGVYAGLDDVSRPSFGGISGLS